MDVLRMYLEGGVMISFGVLFRYLFELLTNFASFFLFRTFANLSKFMPVYFLSM
jgi:hypothetical protein